MHSFPLGISCMYQHQHGSPNITHLNRHNSTLAELVKTVPQAAFPLPNLQIAGALQKFRAFECSANGEISRVVSVSSVAALPELPKVEEAVAVRRRHECRQIS
jgi:hypothetical protein